MNLHLLYRGYTVKNSDMPILSEWREYYILAKEFGVLPNMVKDNMNDPEISMSLSIYNAEQEAKNRKE